MSRYDRYEETWKDICKSRSVKDGAKQHGESLSDYINNYAGYVIPIGVSEEEIEWARKIVKRLVTVLEEGKKLHKCYDERTFPKYVALDEYCVGSNQSLFYENEDEDD